MARFSQSQLSSLTHALRQSAKGGRQVSKEPFNHGMQIGFVLEFASPEDLYYYCDHDEAHQAFIKEWALPERGICDGVVVLDFEEGWKGA